MNIRKVYLGLIGFGIWVFNIVYFLIDAPFLPYNFSSMWVLFVLGLIGTFFIFLGARLYKR